MLLIKDVSKYIRRFLLSAFSSALVLFASLLLTLLHLRIVSVFCCSPLRSAVRRLLAYLFCGLILAHCYLPLLLSPAHPSRLPPPPYLGFGCRVCSSLEQFRNDQTLICAIYEWPWALHKGKGKEWQSFSQDSFTDSELSQGKENKLKRKHTFQTTKFGPIVWTASMPLAAVSIVLLRQRWFTCAFRFPCHAQPYCMRYVLGTLHCQSLARLDPLTRSLQRGLHGGPLVLTQSPIQGD